MITPMQAYRRLVLNLIRVSALMLVLVASFILALAAYSVVAGNGNYKISAIPLLILLILLAAGVWKISKVGLRALPRPSGPNSTGRK